MDKAKQNLKTGMEFYLNPCFLLKTTCKAEELTILKLGMTFKTKLNIANDNNLKIIMSF